MFSNRSFAARAVADDALVVRYTGQHAGFYVMRVLPFIVVFAGLAVLYLDDDVRRLFFSRNSSRPKPFSWFEFSFLLALLTAALADLVLTLRRVQPGAIALTVAVDGIAGPVYHMTRLLAWDEIADVAVSGKFLVIRRQPRTLLGQLASRGFGEINIPVGHIDRDVAEILAATRRFVPASARYAPAS